MNLPFITNMNMNIDQSSASKSMDEIQAAPTEMSCCDTKETTDFFDEGEAITVSKVQKHEVAKFVWGDSDIKNFLAKPFLITQGTWHTSNTFAGGALYSGSIAAALNGNAYWTNKLQGYLLMRAKAVLRLVINANPFQQGKLVMGVMPLQTNFTADSGFATRHTGTLQGFRQLPCVEIDCRDTVAILEIPYIAPNNWYNLKTHYYDWGTVYLNVLSVLALTSTTDTTVDYTIYLHFEDLELGAPMVPQMSKPKFKSKSNLSETEAESYTKTSVSGVLKSVSSAATALADVPLISSIAAPAAWVTGVMGNVAAAFGWSKPISEEASHTVSRQFNRYMACSDGLDTSYPLAISATNKIEASDVTSLYGVDEMSAKFLYNVSTFWKNFSWSGTVPSGDSGSSLLLSQFIAPTLFYGTGSFTSGAHVITYHQGPPIYYLTPLFALWRGSIEITIKFAKTQYHSGRLQVTWTPDGGAGATVPTRASSLLALREIIDIRTQSEITLLLPYMCDSNYLPIGTSSGRLDILVLNELRAPDSVYNSIDCLVYVRGGPDFEFAVPNDTQIWPYSPQMDSTSLTQLISKPVANSWVPTEDCQQASECIGEKWRSIKQFLMRYVPMFSTNTRDPSTVSINPFFLSIPSVSTAGAMVQGDIMGGPLNYFAFMYLFQRGSLNFGLSNIGDPSPTVSALMAITPDPAQGTVGCWGSTFRSTVNTGNGTGPSYTSYQYPTGGYLSTDLNVGLWTAKIPYYCQQKASVVVNTPYNASPLDGNGSSPLGRLSVYSNSDLSTAVYYRAAGDDYQLSYFLGAPPIYVSST
jgi:hypothetical protein